MNASVHREWLHGVTGQSGDNFMALPSVCMLGGEKGWKEKWMSECVREWMDRSRGTNKLALDYNLQRKTYFKFPLIASLADTFESI